MADVFLKLLNMSITASWLVLAVILLRFILKRMPKWIDCLLWGIVGLRLIMPFSFESVLSLIPTTETVPTRVVIPQVPTADSIIPDTVHTADPVITPTVTPTEGTVDHVQMLITAASAVWIIGITVMLIYGAVSYLRVSRTVRASIRHEGNVYFCDNIDSPFLLGVFRPRIYLPSGIDVSQAHYVISHEKAHIARRDHLWKPVGFLLLSAYWFNPVMWVAYILLCRDIEKACDEKVIGDMDTNEKKGYMEALVSCSVRRRMIMVCPLAFGEMGVKERVKNVINYKKPTVWLIAVALIASAVLAVCFLTDPIAGSDAPDVTEGNSTEGIVTDIGGTEGDSVSDEGGDDTINDINDLIKILDAEREECLNAIGGETDYLDMEYVKKLTLDNFRPSKDAYMDFCSTVADGVVETLIERLPEESVYTDVYSILYSPDDTIDIFLLEPDKAPYDEYEEKDVLIWYLEYRLGYCTVYGSDGDRLFDNAFGFEDIEDYDFGDMIVVVDRFYTDIFYFDSAANKRYRLDITADEVDEELEELYSNLARNESDKETIKWLKVYYKNDPEEYQRIMDELGLPAE